MDSHQLIAQELRSGRCGSVVLPAGHGKTHLIVRVAKIMSDEGRHVQILTHTNAAVKSMRRNFMKQFGIIPDQIRVQTIDSFCQFHCVPFYSSCGFSSRHEVAITENYPELHRGIQQGVQSNRHLTRRICSRIDCLLVDEYQDCSQTQHEVILTLSSYLGLPTFVFGDPLQYLFHFRENHGEYSPRWIEDVLREFPAYEVPSYPWRWHSDSSSSLSQTVCDARESLLNPDFTFPAVLTSHFRAISDQDLRSVVGEYRRKLRRRESLIIIGRSEFATRVICDAIGPPITRMSVLHDTRCKEVCSHIDRTGWGDAFGFIRDFLEGISVGWSSVIPISVILHSEIVTAGEKRIETLARQLISDPTSELMVDFLEAYVDDPRTHVWEPPLADNLINAIRLYQSTKRTLVESLRLISPSEQPSRGISQKILVSRPLLCKGLEFDHAIVVDPEQFKKKEALYVAITRASKSLTLIRLTNT